ncbi:MAG: phosphatase PAP2 family protein [Myxococcota bacterium]|nr:phosphatase PAP2 family protein [Myxococcota bacterium]
MDVQIFRFLQPLLLAVLNEPAWVLISSWALPGLLIIAGSIWAQRHKQWKTLALCLACGLLAETLNSHLIKPIFALPRPCLSEGLSLLQRCSSTYSMPSSHAVSIVAGLLPLAWAWRSAAPVFVFSGGLFIISRIALGMHWPSDLIVGALIGSGIGLLGISAQKRFAAR